MKRTKPSPELLWVTEQFSGGLWGVSLEGLPPPFPPTAGEKHLGPGPHPSGTDQSVHGSGGGGMGSRARARRAQRELDRLMNLPRLENGRLTPEGISQRLDQLQGPLLERARLGQEEGAVGIDPWGNVILEKSGTHTGIDFSPQEINTLFRGASSHSHPLDWGFSTNDFLFMHATRLSEMRAVAKTHTYIFIPSEDDNGLYMPDVVARAFIEVGEAYYKILQDTPLRISNTDEFRDRMNREIADKLATRIAEQTGGTYIVRRNDP